jgi:hypothetical protein
MEQTLISNSRGHGLARGNSWKLRNYSGVGCGSSGGLARGVVRAQEAARQARELTVEDTEFMPLAGEHLDPDATAARGTFLLPLDGPTEAAGDGTGLSGGCPGGCPVSAVNSSIERRFSTVPFGNSARMPSSRPPRCSGS